MTPRQQAILIRFIEGLIVVELPILTIELSRPTPEWRLLGLGLLGGLTTAVAKYFAPQLTTEGIAPVAPVLPVPTVPN